MSVAPVPTGDVRGPRIRIRGLEVTFPGPAGPLRAADGVDLELAAGATVGLVGESGCGKTVTGLSLLRLVPPPGRVTGGEILLDGTDLLTLPPAAMDRVRGAEISIVFQEPMTSLNPVFSVGEQVAEVFRVHRAMGRGPAWSAAVEVLRRVGIPEPAVRARDYPHRLSGGMRQRVMIAMALACEPAVLVADEPTTALDVTVQAQILDLLLAMQDQLGTGVLFISHDLGVVSEVADRVAVMYAGRIVEEADAAELFAIPLHPYTAGLIGTIPRLEGRRPRLPTIPGRVPDLRRLPAGCRFSDRCPRADPGCRQADPPVTEPLPGHRVACYKAAPPGSARSWA